MWLNWGWFIYNLQAVIRIFYTLIDWVKGLSKFINVQNIEDYFALYLILKMKINLQKIKRERKFFAFYTVNLRNGTILHQLTSRSKVVAVCLRCLKVIIGVAIQSAQPPKLINIFKKGLLRRRHRAIHRCTKHTRVRSTSCKGKLGNQNSEPKERCR